VYLEALRENGIDSHVSARDKNYNAVFHLVSAAIGAESFYTLANNSARRETLAEAAELDRKTLRAWTGAPHLRVIDNSTDFEGKLARLDREVSSALGIPVPLEVEKKFLCGHVDYSTLPIGAQTVEIEQVYLFSEVGTVLRVRKRGQHGSFTYYRTEKKEVSKGVRTEKECLIRAEEYELSLRFQLPGTRPIRKSRTCFVFENQYFELDAIPQRDGSVLHLLEIELTDVQQTVLLPPFIHIVREVTEDDAFTNFALARVA
jgi:CYTH domain-containing protein